MNAALQGLLVGVAVAVALFIFDYMMIRRGAAERAKRNHKTVVELDGTEKKRIAALLRFCVLLPPVLAAAFWVLDKV